MRHEIGGVWPVGRPSIRDLGSAEAQLRAIRDDSAPPKPPVWPFRNGCGVLPRDQLVLPSAPEAAPVDVYCYCPVNNIRFQPDDAALPDEPLSFQRGLETAWCRAPIPLVIHSVTVASTGGGVDHNDTLLRKNSGRYKTARRALCSARLDHAVYSTKKPNVGDFHFVVISPRSRPKRRESSAKRASSTALRLEPMITTTSSGSASMPLSPVGQSKVRSLYTAYTPLRTSFPLSFDLPLLADYETR